jgi:hypothetical protein
LETAFAAGALKPSRWDFSDAPSEPMAFHQKLNAEAKTAI